MTREPPIDIGEIVKQLEPIGQDCGAHVGTLGEAAQLSMAVSLRRIADALWGNETHDGGTTGIIQLVNGIEQNGRRY